MRAAYQRLETTDVSFIRFEHIIAVSQAKFKAESALTSILPSNILFHPV